jgi:hypothetical protein
MRSLRLETHVTLSPQLFTHAIVTRLGSRKTVEIFSTVGELQIYPFLPCLSFLMMRSLRGLPLWYGNTMEVLISARSKHVWTTITLYGILTWALMFRFKHAALRVVGPAVYRCEGIF